MLKKILEFKEAFYIHAPRWFSRNLTKITIGLFAGLYAMFISWPQLVTSIVVQVIDHTIMPVRNTLADIQNVHYFVYVNFIVFLIIILLAIVTAVIYTQGVLAAGKRLQKDFDKDETVYSNCQRIVDQYILDILNDKSPGMNITLVKILQNILVLDEYSVQDDISCVADCYGSLIASTNNTEQLRDFISETFSQIYAPGETARFMRLQKSEFPSVFATIRDYSIVEVIPFESMGDVYFLMMFSKRKEAFKRLNYNYSIDVINRLITTQSIYYHLCKECDTIDSSHTEENNGKGDGYNGSNDKRE